MTGTTTLDLAPRFATGSPMRVVGLAGRYTDATRDRIPEQWARFAARLPEVEGRADPAAFGLVYELGGDAVAFEYVTGVMVAEDAPLPEGFVERRPPIRRYAVFARRGDISELMPCVHAIFAEWMPRSGHRPAGDNPILAEVYGEDFDPAARAGAFEIWVPIAER